MSKGRSNQGTVVSGELPEYVQPYLEDLLVSGLGTVNPETGKREGGVIFEDYIPYGNVDPETGEFIPGSRVAEVSPTRDFVRDQIKDLYDVGAPYMGEAMDVQRETIQGMRLPSTFTGDIAAQYMSPYAGAVIEAEKQAARDEFEAQKDAIREQATRAGALGGSREGIQEYLRRGELEGKIAGIEQAGRQAAFENAQSQFERDRAAELGRSRAVLGATEGLAALGQQSESGILGRLRELEKIAGQEERRRQQELDLAYEDFINRRDLPLTQLEQARALISGVPLPTSSTTYAPDTTVRDLLGLGIAGLGAYGQYKAATS